MLLKKVSNVMAAPFHFPPFPFHLRATVWYMLDNWSDDRGGGRPNHRGTTIPLPFLNYSVGCFMSPSTVTLYLRLHLSKSYYKAEHISFSFSYLPLSRLYSRLTGICHQRRYMQSFLLWLKDFGQTYVSGNDPSWYSFLFLVYVQRLTKHFEVNI